VDLDKPASKQYLEAFELGKERKTPCYLLYVGHEAFEKCTGPQTLKDLSDWYARARRGEASPKAAKPKQQREYLKDAPENMVYLRKRLSAPSCGMLWCMSHRYEILEYVDAQGNVVGRVNR
jgi:hypothetical protein